MDRRGITLTELLTGIGIISVVLTLAGFEFQGWQRKYRTELQIRTLYTDLMGARAEATARKRRHLVVFDAATPKRYDVFEDADNDGSGYPDPDDRYLPRFSKDYTDDPFPEFLHNLPGNPLVLVFNKRGLANRLFTIRVPHDEARAPEYDCVTIHRSRINPGKHDGKKCRHL